MPTAPSNCPWIITDAAARDLLRITRRGPTYTTDDARAELQEYARQIVGNPAKAPKVLESGVHQYRLGKPLRARLRVDPGPPARLVEVLPDHEGRAAPYERCSPGSESEQRHRARRTARRAENGRALFVADLEILSAADLQSRIQGDDDASTRLLQYLDDRDEHHSGEISGATLAAVAGVDGRTWRRWVGAEQEFPLGARRAIIAAAYCVPAEDIDAPGVPG